MAIYGLDDYDFIYGDLLFRRGSTYTLSQITGLDLPDVDTATAQRSGQDGAFVFGDFFKERVMTFTGRVKADAAGIQSALSVLRAAFAPAVNGSQKSLIFQLPELGEVYIPDAKPSSMRYTLTAIETAVGFADFIATITAGDPRIYSTEEHTVVTTGPPGGGVVFPITFPLVFTAPGGNYITVNNAGNYRAPLRATFIGPLTNPGLVNAETGEVMQVMATLGLGDVMIIDTAARTVFLNGASAYATLTSLSSFLYLVPGDNTLTTLSDSGTGSITVAARDTWV